ncbi:phospholipid N-methyltransferase [Bradyrhizobium elkanii]|uniref:DUF3560 domain-containing protein n=1 Tax=Bradyrhizobium elkanii TaxID=29448 RepID=UPI00091C9611|nr:DUF3560 domain-containing protein [Bradyrhizobium elkanii]MCW2195060.1 phospholipid N-methyltransferase [Bradyrhizobium elkanii]NWL67247.1 DUF3560 domain-containing protein [Bradyrhizobium elkanii]OIM94088.1 hypothetical protein BLN97_12505 [Bradyrhizobium elkanii]
MQHSATYSPDDNKLRLYPAHRLDAEDYARVKAAGFKWAPRQELFVKPTWSPGAEDLLIEMCGEIGDEDTTLTDRAEQRADRFEEYSDKRLSEANRAREAVDQIAERFAMGQPILVGHHSEKSARRDKEKMDAGMRKALKLWDTSNYWTARAAGAIAHAKYKELPAVRHRRIKTIESDKRKLERLQADTERQLKAWQIVADITDPEKQRAAGLAVANAGGFWSMSFPLADYPRDPPASQYEGPMGLWSAIDGNVITAAQAAAIAIPSLERSGPSRARWLAHYDNRLAYERAMLAEQIGAEATANPLADRFAFAVGGQIQTRRGDEWLTIVKVSRGANGSVSSIQTAAPSGSRGRGVYWKVESVRDYRAPTAENVATAKAATKLPPLCNYPGEGFREMTEAEWKGRRQWSDFSYVRGIEATETAQKHRARFMPVPGKMWERQQVFITDAKRVDPPRIAPAAEPQAPAEFVAEYVAPPVADLDATLEVVGEIMAEPSPVETVPEVVPVAPAEASRHLPDTADLPAPSSADTFEAMRAMLKGGGVQVVVAPQLFPTSHALAGDVAELADIRDGHRVLEPSAGTGVLIEAARRNVDGYIDIVAVEINPTLARGLAGRFPGVKVINADFLEVDSSEMVGKFDRILMNSPFERGADIRHIEHARTFLRPGGRLVAICADGPRQRAKFEPIATEYRALPAGSFKAAGTMVNTALVVIDGPPPG